MEVEPVSGDRNSEGQNRADSDQQKTDSDAHLGSPSGRSNDHSSTRWNCPPLNGHAGGLGTANTTSVRRTGGDEQRSVLAGVWLSGSAGLATNWRQSGV